MVFMMNNFRKISKLLILMPLIFLACSGQIDNQGQPAKLIEPFLEVKVHGDSGNNPKVALPFVVWDSYEYKDIIVHSYLGGKEKGCVVIENEGRPIQIDTEIKFLEDAPCIFSRLTTSDGLPHIYNAGLMKILIVETGQEVYTWSKAVQLNK
tara:strand:- start:15067 stop:15522 length:456 start_codon:yes stop_codon:yes gene_type:complete